MHGRVSQIKKRVRASDNIVLLITVLIAIGIVSWMVYFNVPQKWHAAACWTLVPFCAVVPTYRRYWSSWRFWAALTICLFAHLGIMWLIFARGLASVTQIGTIYVIPFELVEAFVLLVAITILMRALGQKDKWIRL
jgi:hypothetical protein